MTRTPTTLGHIRLKADQVFMSIIRRVSNRILIWVFNATWDIFGSFFFLFLPFLTSWPLSFSTSHISQYLTLQDYTYYTDDSNEQVWSFSHECKNTASPAEATHDAHTCYRTLYTASPFLGFGTVMKFNLAHTRSAVKKNVGQIFISVELKPPPTMRYCEWCEILHFGTSTKFNFGLICQWPSNVQNNERIAVCDVTRSNKNVWIRSS